MSPSSPLDPSSPVRRLVQALGWFSIGLGFPQVAVPRRMNELIGVRDSEGARALMRAVGVRELVAAAGILSRPKPAGWLWARVAGDVMDLALLGAVLSSKDNRQRRVASATTAVAGIAVLDLIASARVSRASDRTTEEGAIRGKVAVTVNRPPAEVYGYWHDFENLPRFMYHLEAVQTTGEGRSHWAAKAPAGTTVEWDAEIVEDTPNELIAWRSLDGADVDNSGSVRFAPAYGGRATEVTVELEYALPGGAVGALIARLFGEEPVQQMKDDLRRLKQVLETGEVVRSEGSPDGSRTQRQFHQQEAQPPA